MKTVYKCEKCGRTFEDYSECANHEMLHYDIKSWCDDEDEKVIRRENEYSQDMILPSAVVVPMIRSLYDEEANEWKRETIYLKYFYSSKRAEQVFPIDENAIK